MNKLLIILLVVCATRLSAQTVDDYVAEAEKNNPALKSRLEEFEAAMQRIPQVGGLPDPTLTISALGQMVETRVGQQMARISLSQMFPWFGTLEAQKNSAASLAEARYQSYLDARNGLGYQVRSAYYPLVELEEKIKLQRDNLEILSMYKTLATSKFQNGSGKLADALRVDIMINDAKTEIEILEARRQPLRVAFNGLLNRPGHTSIAIDSTHQTEDELQFVLDSVLLRNPKLAELDLRLASAKAQQEVAVKQGMPKLGVGFEYIVTAKRPGMTFEDNGKDAYMPMVSVTLPIYRKKYRAAVKEAEHMEQSYTEMKTDLANQLTTQFEMALFERERAGVELRLYNDQISRTQQVIDLLLTGYGNSGTDFEEILRMQQALIKYEVNKATAEREYRTAVAKLLYLISNDSH